VFSPDGRVLASAGGDTSGVQFWDVAAGREIVQPQSGHLGFVNALAFSRDGKNLYSMGAEGAFIDWKLSTDGKPGATKLDAKPKKFGTFSPDGKLTVAVELEDNPKAARPWPLSARLLDTQTGKEIRFLGKDYPYQVAFSRDNKLLALATFQQGNESPNGISVIDVPSGKQLHRFKGSDKRGFMVLAISPDGKKLAAGTWEEKPHFHLWDLDTGKKVPSCDPDHWVGSIVFSPDSRLVALGSGGDHSNCVSVWEVATATRVHLFDKQPNAMVAAFSSTGRYLATGGNAGSLVQIRKPEENMVRVWELTTGKQAAEFAGHHSGVTALAFAPDGRTLASGGGDSQILLWDLPDRRTDSRRPILLTKEELETRWNDLASADAAKAFKTIAELAAAGDAAVRFLKGRLAPVPHADPAQARRALELVADLNSDKFTVRQKAATDLEQLGSIATGALRKALTDSPTLETRRRVEQILAGLDQKEASGWLPVSRALEVLELVGSTQAREVLRDLAQGDPAARQTREAKAALDK
jgi:WD40 repeat protein